LGLDLGEEPEESEPVMMMEKKEGMQDAENN
jgi:hypothetical protein